MSSFDVAFKRSEGKRLPKKELVLQYLCVMLGAPDTRWDVFAVILQWDCKYPWMPSGQVFLSWRHWSEVVGHRRAEVLEEWGDKH